MTGDEYRRELLPAMEAAAEAGIPVVADLENNESPYFAHLLGLVDHLILSRPFARRLARAQ